MSIGSNIINNKKFCIDCGKEVLKRFTKGRCHNCYEHNRGLKRQAQAPKIYCADGCGELIPSIDINGNPMRYKHTHNMNGEHNHNWNGGIYPDSKGYLLCYKPDHPFSNSKGYVLEHRLIYEHYLKILFDEDIYIPRDIDIHHINKNIQDNSLINIEPLTKQYHGSISGKEGKGKKKTKKR